MASTTTYICDYCGSTNVDGTTPVKDWGSDKNIRLRIRVVGAGGVEGDLCKPCFADFVEDAARQAREWANA